MTYISLKEITCWCGTPYAVPERLANSAINDGHTIYCPHGHTNTWADTEKDKLRRERDRLKQSVAQRDDLIADKDRAILAKEKDIKNLKKRASAGTCPCCQRTFSNMATHMKKLHPDFVTAERPALKVVK